MQRWISRSGREILSVSHSLICFFSLFASSHLPPLLHTCKCFSSSKWVQTDNRRRRRKTWHKTSVKWLHRVESVGMRRMEEKSELCLHFSTWGCGQGNVWWSDWIFDFRSVWVYECMCVLCVARMLKQTQHTRREWKRREWEDETHIAHSEDRR